MVKTTTSFNEYLRDKHQGKNLNLDKYKFKFVNLNDYCVTHNLDDLMRTTLNIVVNGLSYSHFYISVWKNNRVETIKNYIEEERDGSLYVWNDDDIDVKHYSNIVFYIDEILNKLIEKNVVDKTHKLFNGIIN